MPSVAYKYWEIVQDSSLKQGDFLPDCPIPSYPDDFDLKIGTEEVTRFETKTYNTIVMTQSCDLVGERGKTDFVLLCPVYTRRQLLSPTLKTANADFWRSVVERKKMGLFWLPHWDAEDDPNEGLVVHYQQSFCLPIGYVRRKAASISERKRLLAEYRVGLVQEYGNMFSRPALPEFRPSDVRALEPEKAIIAGTS